MGESSLFLILLSNLLLSGGVLVLLVLIHEIVHVGLSLSELHLVHTLAGVPVEESLAPEHGSELLSDTLEHLLDGSGVSDEGGRHLEALGGDVTNGGLDIAGDPLNKVRGVLILDKHNLLVNLLAGHASTEQSRGSQVATMAGVSSAHHVLGIPHLGRELRDGEGPVVLGSTAGEGGKADHEEVEAGERDQVNGKLAEISVELTREAEAASNARHDCGHKMVKVTIGRGGELEAPEADVIEGLVVNDEGLIGVLDKLVDREGGVVGLDNSIRDLGGGDNREGAHHAVGVLLADLGDQESSHSRASASSERMGQLESLEAVAAFSLLADNIEDAVDEFRTLRVVSFAPVVSSTRLAENKVIRPEDLPIGSRADRVHGARLKVHEDSTGNHLSCDENNSFRHGTSMAVLTQRLTSICLGEVDIDALQLEVRFTSVVTSLVNAVLLRNNLPASKKGERRVRGDPTQDDHR